jgi:hypothetical protein
MPRSARTRIISRSRQLVDALAVHPDHAGVGLEQPRISFRIVDFPGAARAQEDLRVPLEQREAHVVEDHLVVERQRHAVEDHDRARRRRLRISGGSAAWCPEASGHVSTAG